MSAYGELARYYDGLTRDVDYTQWVAWYQKWFQRSEVPVKIVLDLACGTGTLTCLLAQAGYSMIGTDLSIEMLSEAQEKALELTCEPPVFLHQSMDKLDLFGTIDACVSSLDSLNYVTDEAILRAAFHKIHTFPHAQRLLPVRHLSPRPPAQPGRPDVRRRDGGRLLSLAGGVRSGKRPDHLRHGSVRAGRRLLVPSAGGTHRTGMGAGF